MNATQAAQQEKLRKAGGTINKPVHQAQQQQQQQVMSRPRYVVCREQAGRLVPYTQVSPIHNDCQHYTEKMFAV